MSKPRVAVAMSGGVDSSVVAALLVEQGYEAVGFTLKLWGGDGSPESNRPCCTVSMANDAKIVCDQLGIPHYTLDMQDTFKREVIDRFESDYLNGITPNPCVQCNSRIKWGSMWEQVKRLGFDRLATGHYARTVQTPEGRTQLLQGIDRSKDQSYFLWEIPAEVLSVTMFPLGDLEKSVTRQIAEKYRLSVADKVESQEICFVPSDDYRSWLKERQSENRERLTGEIVGRDGVVLGQHDGYTDFTIGQRKGLGLGGGAKTLFVTHINADNKQVVVGEESDLDCSEFSVSSLNRFISEPLDDVANVSVKIRYRSRAVPVSIADSGNGSLTVHTDNPVQAVTPGQSAVFYRGEEVIAGGIIGR